MKKAQATVFFIWALKLSKDDGKNFLLKCTCCKIDVIASNNLIIMTTCLTMKKYPLSKQTFFHKTYWYYQKITRITKNMSRHTKLHKPSSSNSTKQKTQTANNACNKNRIWRYLKGKSRKYNSSSGQDWDQDKNMHGIQHITEN